MQVKELIKILRELDPDATLSIEHSRVGTTKNVYVEACKSVTITSEKPSMI